MTRCTATASAKLGAVRVPCLIQHRRTDARVPIEAARAMAQAIPGARLIEYPDGDHAFWAGDTEAILGDIEEFVTGARNAGVDDLERVLATVLFTDIVGSTSSAVELGDRRWRSLLDEHDSLARQMVDRHHRQGDHRRRRRSEHDRDDQRCASQRATGAPAFDDDRALLTAAVSGVVGFLAIAFLMYWVRRGSFTLFALYRVALGGALIYALYRLPDLACS